MQRSIRTSGRGRESPDPHDSSESLRRLKIHYLRQVAPVEERPPVIWGAGRNGKRLAQVLKAAGLPATAFSDLHPGRVGQEIHGAGTLCRTIPVLF